MQYKIVLSCTRIVKMKLVRVVGEIRYLYLTMLNDKYNTKLIGKIVKRSGFSHKRNDPVI